MKSTRFVSTTKKSNRAWFGKAIITIIFLSGWLGGHAVWAQATQGTTVKTSLYSGYFVAGYVDGGGFTNFTGPNVTITRGHSAFVFSALPSLRYKRDNSEPFNNAFVTPALGAGFTYAYKKVAFQLASYYNARTATADGQWHLGFGLGLRMSEFNKKK